MKTMKIILYILLFLAGSVSSVFAGRNTTGMSDEVEYRFALGVQLGTDIGGAIPFPFKHVPSPFNPYPRLFPSLGAKLSFPITSKWALGTEITYKGKRSMQTHGLKTSASTMRKMMLSPVLPDRPRWGWILRWWKFPYMPNTLSATKRTVYFLVVILLMP